MKEIPLRIVVVDDNDDYRKLIRWALSSNLNRIILEEMTTGQQLIDWLAHYRSEKEPMVDDCLITVILLDLHMPGLSGLDTLKLLGDMTDLPYIPVIMLTGSTSAPLKQQAYEQGIHLYMVKPTGPNSLYRIVEAVKLCYRDTLRIIEQQKLPPIRF